MIIAQAYEYYLSVVATTDKQSAIEQTVAVFSHVGVTLKNLTTWIDAQ